MTLSPFDLIKGCISLATFIKDLADDATFLQDSCDQLSDHIENIVQPLGKLKTRQYDRETSEELRGFIKKLSKILQDSRELVDKCGTVGKLKALTKKASYAERFNRLEKKLEHLVLPAALLNMLQHSDNLEEMKKEMKKEFQQVRAEVQRQTNTPDSSSNFGARCSICSAGIKQGMKLYHCTYCPLPGFNACSNCYTPFTHDDHSDYIESGVYPDYDPYGSKDDTLETSNVVCDVCNRDITEGKEFYHCTACPSGFDVCASCYSPHVHDKHKQYFQHGFYPDLDPYGMEYYESSSSSSEESDDDEDNLEATGEDKRAQGKGDVSKEDKEYKDAFNYFDKDRDGQISLENLKDGAHTLGEDLDEDDLRKVLVKFDEDGSGAIELNEFIQMMKMIESQGLKSQLQIDEYYSDSFYATGASCDLCRKYVKKGDTFCHCETCEDFDVCMQCYSDTIHSHHKDSLQKGMYPKYSPYVIRMGPIQSAYFYVEEDANLTPFSDVQRFYKYGPRGPQMISGFKIFTEKRENLLVGIQIKYGDIWSPIHGKKSPKPKMVTVSPYDHITKVTWSESMATNMLQFETLNGKIYGPYGDASEGTQSECSASDKPLLYISGCVRSDLDPEYSDYVWRLSFFFAKGDWID